MPRAWYYPFVETIAEYCITQGCGGTEYCPSDLVTRRIAAIFIARAFDLDNLNSCVEYCDPNTCDGGSYCEDYGDCGSYSSTCDESGSKSRVCHDFQCTGPLTDGTCSGTTRTETASCSRNTDGVVVNDWASWGLCDVDPTCGGVGDQFRSRAVCANGSAVGENQTQPCVESLVDDDADGVCDLDDVCTGDDAFGDADGNGACEPLLSVGALVPGEEVTFTLSGAPPGATAVFAVGLNGSGSTCLGQAGPCMSLEQPRLLGVAVVDSGGFADLLVTVPVNAPIGAIVEFQGAWILGLTGGPDAAEVSSNVELRVVASP